MKCDRCYPPWPWKLALVGLAVCLLLPFILR
jgi:hypothetical protein